MTPRASSHLPETRREWWALAVILLLAAGLRLGYPGISEFKMDEAHIAEMALDLAQGHAFPLQGIATSVGLPKPPLSIFIYALPFALTPNPLGATLFTGLLNVLAVALCWWMARRYWGQAAGLTAALLFATSPWAVVYARKIWEPNLVSPFVLACVATGLLGFLEGRPWAQALHILCFGLTLQLHYHTLLIVWLAPLLILLFFRRVHWQAVLLGSALALIPALPFIYHVAWNWAGVAANLSGFAGGAATWSTQSLEIWWMLTSGAAIHSLAGSPAYLDFLDLLPGLSILQWAVGALCLLGLGVAAVQALRSILARRDEPATWAGGIILLWAVIPVLLTLRQSTPLYTHYFTSLFPAPYLAAGMLVGRIWRGKSALTRRLSLAAIALLGLAQVWVMATLILFVGARATPEGFGIPLRTLLQTRARALALGSPVVIVGEGDDGQTGAWVSVFDVLLRDVPHRFVDGRRAMLWPAAAATIILAPGLSESEGAGAALRLEGARTMIESASVIRPRQGEQPFRVLRLERPVNLQGSGFTEIPGPRALDDGAELIGYRWEGELKPGQEITWQVAWRVWKSPSSPQTRYQLFSHLLDGRGNQRAQTDAPTPPTADWGVGDLVIQSSRLRIPTGAEGPFSVRLGMYSYPALAAVPVLDVAAQPFADAITVGPLSR
jgi:hypothetical protein